MILQQVLCQRSSAHWTIRKTYLRNELLTSCSNFSFLFPWCSRFLPQTIPAFCMQLAAASSTQLVSADLNNHCSNTYNFSDLSPCCSTAILPIVVTELTEYNCQSVCFYRGRGHIELCLGSFLIWSHSSLFWSFPLESNTDGHPLTDLVSQWLSPPRSTPTPAPSSKPAMEVLEKHAYSMS